MGDEDQPKEVSCGQEVPKQTEETPSGILAEQPEDSETAVGQKEEEVTPAETAEQAEPA